MKLIEGLESLVYDIDTFQEESAKFAIYPQNGTGSKEEFMYLACGLCGESGEVAEKIKKYYRDGVFKKEDLIKELGDVLWYVAQLCTAMNIDCSEALTQNLLKLTDRQLRNKLQGSGDDR